MLPLLFFILILNYGLRVLKVRVRDAKPQPQIVATPRAHLFKIDPELKKAQHRKWSKDWYRRHHTPKYKPRRATDIGLSGMG